MWSSGFFLLSLSGSDGRQGLLLVVVMVVVLDLRSAAVCVEGLETAHHEDCSRGRAPTCRNQTGGGWDPSCVLCLALVGAWLLGLGCQNATSTLALNEGSFCLSIERR